MTPKQGSLSLLEHPVAQELLESRIMARLAYTEKDGTPRVLPIWFHWNGKEIVLSTGSGSHKAAAIAEHSQVAITIDTNEWPYKVLLIRGVAHLETVDGITFEYAAAARRYFGEEQGNAWVEQMSKTSSQMIRIAVQPTWVSVLDFVTRFPGALASEEQS